MATISAAFAVAVNHQQAGRPAAAETILRRILAVEPDHADSLHLLGIILHQAGQSAAAVSLLRHATELNPAMADYHNSLGEAYRGLKAWAEAIASYRRAIELRPEDPQGHNHLGAAFHDQGRLEEAAGCFRAALRLQPDFAAALNNLAIVFYDLGRWEDAIACYRRALVHWPTRAEIFSNLGNALRQAGRLTEAEVEFRRAVELRPDFVPAYRNWGVACKDQGKLDDAVQCFRRAVEIAPQDPLAHSSLLYMLHYLPGVTPAALSAAHAEYDRRHAAALRNALPSAPRPIDPPGRLRLGFVSPDLRFHPVGRFFVPVLEHFSPAVETYCYSNCAAYDAWADRARAAATHWRDVWAMSDQALAERIRADRIDVLFDLTGHSAHDRMLVFARRPAPVQITWIGYEGTTGLSAIDYLLADQQMVPPGRESDYCEQVLRMPDGYVCYDAPRDAPAVGPLPALQRGGVTFGSFNNLAKITPAVVDVWAAILRRVPGSRLLLKYKALQDGAVQQRYRTLFTQRGISPDRLDLSGDSTFTDYLAAYNQIDLALDTFPFSGSATTCDALWMGVPVITCPGETFASRHSLSHLTTVGITKTIATSIDHYVELAVRLASDLPRLAALRTGLRQQMADSPLCDGRRFAANLEALLSK